MGALSRGRVPSGQVLSAAKLLHAVRARPGRLKDLSGFHSKSLLYGVFVWAGGRLTAKNGGFRSGQFPGLSTAQAITRVYPVAAMYSVRHGAHPWSPCIACGGHGSKRWLQSVADSCSPQTFMPPWVGLYPIVTSQYNSTTLYQVSYHIQ